MARCEGGIEEVKGRAGKRNGLEAREGEGKGETARKGMRGKEAKTSC